MSSKLTPERLQRSALVYVRQSTPGQVLHNLESQRRQYALVERARQLGFQDVRVIDDDLGRSGSGLVQRPGFEQLVVDVCAGQVGAILCIEASRLARNGRDWHHLIEMCGLVGAVLIDLDGVYDPGVVNDRLLLGLKGTMSEFELNLFRQRSAEAIRQKAARGELRFELPAGLCWSQAGKIELDPDRRVQEAIRLVFAKFDELRSARQVLQWFRQEGLRVPVGVHEDGATRTVWKEPVYFHILRPLINPMYAGAYVFGKTRTKITVVSDRPRKTVGHKKPVGEWIVLLRGHHPGYITWEQFERHQTILAENNFMKSGNGRMAARGGQALLSGMLRCRRCGRMLKVCYYTRRKTNARYYCAGDSIRIGGGACFGFGATRPDQAISSELLKAVAGNAIDAALAAAEQLRLQREQGRNALRLEIEQMHYEARLAARRFEAVDPENRLVASELESRWNSALKRVTESEEKLRQFDCELQHDQIPDKGVLCSLAQDLPSIWNSPSTDMALKQRIVRILIREIVVDVDDASREILLLIHWTGGRHSELRVKKADPGRHARCTSLEAVEVVRKMADRFADREIANTLNRLAIRTGAGNTWTPLRVCSLRSHHKLPRFDPAAVNREYLTADQAAKRLSICATTVRKLIDLKIIEGTQVVPTAPWEISTRSLESAEVQRVVKAIKKERRIPLGAHSAAQECMFSNT